MNTLMATVLTEVGRRIACGKPLDDLVADLNDLFSDVNSMKLDGVERMEPITADDLRSWFARLTAGRRSG